MMRLTFCNVFTGGLNLFIFDYGTKNDLIVNSIFWMLISISNSKWRKNCPAPVLLVRWANDHNFHQ